MRFEQLLDTTTPSSDDEELSRIRVRQFLGLEMEQVSEEEFIQLEERLSTAMDKVGTIVKNNKNKLVGTSVECFAYDEDEEENSYFVDKTWTLPVSVDDQPYELKYRESFTILNTEESLIQDGKKPDWNKLISASDAPKDEHTIVERSNTGFDLYDLSESNETPCLSVLDLSRCEDTSEIGDYSIMDSPDRADYKIQLGILERFVDALEEDNQISYKNMVAKYNSAAK